MSYSLIRSLELPVEQYLPKAALDTDVCAAFGPDETELVAESHIPYKFPRN
jgi:hypothetical protein